VDRVKADRLRQLALLWVDDQGLGRVPIRVDLIGVLQPRRGAAQLEHVRGVG
jgi:putative endonuclease